MNRAISKTASTQGIAVLALAGLLLLGSLSLACGSDSDASDAPTPVPTAIELRDGDEVDISDDFAGSAPPSLTFSAAGNSVEAGLGSFCYGSVCADAIGDITSVEPLVAEGDQVEATLSKETFSEVSATAVPAASLTSQEVCTPTDGVEPGGPLCGRDGAWLAWTNPTSEGTTLASPTASTTAEIDISALEPGRYVVSLFVRFETGGDASYGVLLDVA